MAKVSGNKACAAKQLLKKAGVPMGRDFHSLSSSQVDAVVAAAKAVGYRKSKSAPGSTGRMFYQYVDRTSCAGLDGRRRRRR